jgi:hypothetical protein
MTEEFLAEEIRVVGKELLETLKATICHGCGNRIGWNKFTAEDRREGRRDWRKCGSCKRARAIIKRAEMR